MNKSSKELYYINMLLTSICPLFLEIIQKPQDTENPAKAIVAPSLSIIYHFIWLNLMSTIGMLSTFSNKYSPKKFYTSLRHAVGGVTRLIRGSLHNH